MSNERHLITHHITNASHYFILEGEIVLNTASLDYETTPQYNLTITVCDPDGLTAMQKVTLDIKDVNEAPVIQNLPDSVTIAEDVVDKIVVSTVEAIDQDGDVISYSLSATWPSSAPFEIDPAGKSLDILF